MQSENIMKQERYNTTAKLLRRNAKRWPDKTAFREKDYGIWQTYTWKDSFEIMKHAGLGLIELGVKRNDRVSFISDNEPEQFWGIYAAQAIGAWSVGIFADCVPQEVKYLVGHSESKVVFARDQEQVDKLLSIRHEIPSVSKVIWWEPKGMRGYTDPWLMSFPDLLKLGKRYDEEHPGYFESIVEQGKGSDVMALYYTSGATGAPKGVMIKYDAMLSMMVAQDQFAPTGPKDTAVAYISPAWIGEPCWGSVRSLWSGMSLNCPEKPDTFLEDFREISPSVVLWASRQWENVASMVKTRINDSDWIKRTMFYLSLPVGYRIADADFSRSRPKCFWKCLYWVARRLLFHRLLDYFGLARVKAAMHGGTVLGADTLRFLKALSLPMLQIYGATEGLYAAHERDDLRRDTVGVPCLGMEVRISNEGEGLFRGPTIFAGYYKEPQKTASALDPKGWFHSGDAVSLLDDGHLVVLGRINEMGELANGIKYAPEYIESQLRFGACIKDAITVGSTNHEFVSVLIDVDFESVGKWAESRHISYTTYVDLSQKSEVADLVLQEIKRVNETLPEVTRIKKYVLLHKEFDPDEAELTRTRKLRRQFLLDRYRELVEAIYANQLEYALKTEVTYRDGRKGNVTATLNIRAVPDTRKGNSKSSDRNLFNDHTKGGD